MNNSDDEWVMPHTEKEDQNDLNSSKNDSDPKSQTDPKDATEPNFEIHKEGNATLCIREKEIQIQETGKATAGPVEGPSSMLQDGVKLTENLEEMRADLTEKISSACNMTKSNNAICENEEKINQLGDEQVPTVKCEVSDLAESDQVLELSSIQDDQVEQPKVTANKQPSSSANICQKEAAATDGDGKPPNLLVENEQDEIVLLMIETLKRELKISEALSFNTQKITKLIKEEMKDYGADGYGGQELKSYTFQSYLSNLFCLNTDVYKGFCGLHFEDPTDPEELISFHPIDFRNIIFQEAGHELRAFITERLHQTRWSIPLVLTDPKTKKSTLYLRNLAKIGSLNAKKKCLYHVDQKFPIFGFARIGKTDNVGVSKSIILNEILKFSGRKVFYNRDMANSNCEKLTQDGMIDFFWFYNEQVEVKLEAELEPTKQAEPKCCVLLNFHGSADEFPELFQFMVNVCNEVYVLMTDLSFPEKLRATTLCKLKVLHITQGRVKKSCKSRNLSAEEFEIIQCQNPNNEGIAKDIEKRIKNFLKAENEILPFSQLSGKIDKDQLCLVNLQSFTAKDMSSKLELMDYFLVEDPTLDKLWKEWSDIEKKKFRNVGNVSDVDVDVIEYYKMVQTLKSQQDDCMECIRAYCSVGEDKGIVQMLHWICHELLKESDRFNGEGQSLSERLTNLDRLQFKFTLSDLVTSIARYVELGLGNDDDFLEFCSQLLIEGYPVELIDGLPRTVHTNWIKKLFGKLDQKMPNSKVMVVSIIGLESSGKSTFLNAMFGFNLLTSPGKCTVGSNIQMLQIDKEMQNQFGGCTHVLVADVEGLASNTNSTLNYNPSDDNELATFIIGISNLCLVNVMGENLKTIERFLEIAVLALLRIKKKDLNCKLVFVHQNVSDPTAPKCNEEGRKNLQEYLEYAFEQARETEKETELTSLNQLLDFSNANDVFYLPHYVDGTKPRSAPNRAYAAAVSRVKKYVLERMSSGSSRKVTFKDLATFIDSIWQAVKTEDFVFNFRNFLEIQVNRDIEKICVDYKCRLQIVENDLLREFCKKLSDGILDKNLCEDSVVMSIRLPLEEQKKNIKKILESEPNLDIKAGLKENKLRQIEAWERVSAQKIKEKYEAYRGFYKTKWLMNEEHAKLDAEFLKICVNEKNEGTESFEDLWTTFIEERKRNVCCAKEAEMNIKEKLIEKLSCKFRHVLEKEPNLLKKYCQIQDNIEEGSKLGRCERTKQYLASLVSQVKKKNQELKAQARSVVDFETETILNGEEVFITSQTLETIILTCFIQLSKKFKNRLSHKQLFKAMCKSLLVKYAPVIQQRLDDSLKRMKPLERFKAQKHHYEATFKSIRQRLNREKLILDRIEIALKDEIPKVLLQLLEKDLQNALETEFADWGKQKLREGFLEFVDLEQRSKDEAFELALYYAFNPKQALTKYVEIGFKYWHEDDEEKTLIELKDRIKEAFSSISDPGKPSVTLAEWLDLFKNQHKNHFQFPCQPFTALEDTTLDGVSMFNKKVCSMIKKIIEEYKPEEMENNELITKLSRSFVASRIGCEEQCPLCEALCDHLTEDHEGDHFTENHISLCITGRHRDYTEEADIRFCPELFLKKDILFRLDKDLIKLCDYKTSGPPMNKWSFTAGVVENSFWKSFITDDKDAECNNMKRLEKRYGYRIDYRWFWRFWANITRKDYKLVIKGEKSKTDNVKQLDIKKA